jgi:hypothetical protein
MAVPLFGYGLAYIFTILWFASIYASLYRLQVHPVILFGLHLHPDAFAVNHDILPRKTLQFDDFLFFAAMTFPPLGGYSGLIAHPGWAEAVVTLQSLVGIGWSVVIFAAIIAYLTPRFERLNTAPMRAEEAVDKVLNRLTDIQDNQQHKLAEIQDQLRRIEQAQVNTIAAQANGPDRAVTAQAHQHIPTRRSPSLLSRLLTWLFPR